MLTGTRRMQALDREAAAALAYVDSHAVTYRLWWEVTAFLESASRRSCGGLGGIESDEAERCGHVRRLRDWLDNTPCPPRPRTLGDVEWDAVGKAVASLGDGESVVLQVPHGIGDLNGSKTVPRVWFRGAQRTFSRRGDMWYVDGTAATMWTAYGHLDDSPAKAAGAIYLAEKRDRREAALTSARYAPELSKITAAD